MSPTIREIAATCFLSPGGVVLHLDKLEYGGYLTREERIARTIRLLRPLPEAPDTTTAIYNYLVEQINTGETPTQGELATAFHVSEQTIRMHLKRLEDAGLIQRLYRTPRGILLTDP